MLKFCILTIVIRCIFERDDKYYPQIFLNDSLLEIQMLEYERIHDLEGIDVYKSRDKSKECDLCYYWYFLDKNFNYASYRCNCCHDMINLLNNSVLSNKGVL